MQQRSWLAALVLSALFLVLLCVSVSSASPANCGITTPSYCNGDCKCMCNGDGTSGCDNPATDCHTCTGAECTLFKQWIQAQKGSTNYANYHVICEARTTRSGQTMTHQPALMTAVSLSDSLNGFFATDAMQSYNAFAGHAAPSTSAYNCLCGNSQDSVQAAIDSINRGSGNAPIDVDKKCVFQVSGDQWAVVFKYSNPGAWVFQANEVRSMSSLTDQGSVIQGAGQPYYFAPGTVEHAWMLLFSSPYVSWRVGADTVTVGKTAYGTCDQQKQLGGKYFINVVPSEVTVNGEDRIELLYEFQKLESVAKGLSHFVFGVPQCLQTTATQLKVSVGGSCKGEVDIYTPSKVPASDKLCLLTKGSDEKQLETRGPKISYSSMPSSQVFSGCDVGSLKSLGNGVYQIRWGTSTGEGQSGYQFDPLSGTTDLGQTFSIAKFTHLNRPIRDAVCTKCTLQFTWTIGIGGTQVTTKQAFGLNLDETPNDFCNQRYNDLGNVCVYGPYDCKCSTKDSCPSWWKGCSDQITWAEKVEATIDLGGKGLYTLQVTGFQYEDDLSTVRTSFITYEGKDNVALLRARIIEGTGDDWPWTCVPRGTVVKVDNTCGDSLSRFTVSAPAQLVTVQPCCLGLKGGTQCSEASTLCLACSDCPSPPTCTGNSELYNCKCVPCLQGCPTNYERNAVGCGCSPCERDECDFGYSWVGDDCNGKCQQCPTCPVGQKKANPQDPCSACVNCLDANNQPITCDRSQGWVLNDQRCGCVPCTKPVCDPKNGVLPDPSTAGCDCIQCEFLPPIVCPTNFAPDPDPCVRDKCVPCTPATCECTPIECDGLTKKNSNNPCALDCVDCQKPPECPYGSEFHPQGYWCVVDPTVGVAGCVPCTVDCGKGFLPDATGCGCEKCSNDCKFGERELPGNCNGCEKCTPNCGADEVIDKSGCGCEKCKLNCGPSHKQVGCSCEACVDLITCPGRQVLNGCTCEPVVLPPPPPPPPPGPVPTPPPPPGCVTDACGRCGGDGTSCLDCEGNFGLKNYDKCGVPCGDGRSCACVAGNNNCDTCAAAVDLCGVCGGASDSCYACDWSIGTGLVYDQCGICGGNGTLCLGCDGELWGKTDCSVAVTPAEGAFTGIALVALVGGLFLLGVAIWRWRARRAALVTMWDGLIDEQVQALAQNPLFTESTVTKTTPWATEDVGEEIGLEDL
mmetsp:Transcript_14807/g.44414  ORF Transcript_14807/g.44414 Transcript_14807/m.44414 type:complete len:1189 (-) Transcript_14807:1265-4831(-)|eukprot:CAMPEP_0177663822 /NCGR_PEP_ID=MMETSP0447-20121125/20134_1 /TAXON_ID=0 /ORGANISM="Stygamoeba regulata, Strain BSH-02190019" /LENGTH=1188 /DNA_ID=CAMNT_0019169691 /DNA_START=155 /DNA_END=3721 /DNA_ORIENTATION=+